MRLMGNIGDLSDCFDKFYDESPHSGLGSITTLPMSDDERAAAVRRPIGFIWDHEPVMLQRNQWAKDQGL